MLQFAKIVKLLPSILYLAMIGKSLSPFQFELIHSVLHSSNIYHQYLVIQGEYLLT